jgi:diguanylate cyclase (GGDEF)-like protein
VAERTAELEESNSKLRELAFYDELTGIGNRRFFEVQAEKLIALAQREKTPTFIVMLDIDRFKVLNDSYGHPFGDTVLQALAELLRTTVRGSDVLCRYGGEEFFILLPFTGRDAALEFCTRLQHSIREMVFAHDGDSVRITASMGLAELAPEAGTLKQLVKQADIALYQAKRNGRDRIEVY